MSVSIRPQLQEKRVGLTLAEPVLVTLTTPERLLAVVLERWRVLAAALLIGAAGGIIAGLFASAAMARGSRKKARSSSSL